MLPLLSGVFHLASVVALVQGLALKVDSLSKAAAEKAGEPLEGDGARFQRVLSLVREVDRRFLTAVVYSRNTASMFGAFCARPGATAAFYGFDELISTFRSLSQPNFRLYFFGQLVSVTGTWMQSLALSWLMWRLTHSPFMLGLVDAARLSPIFLFALVGGSIADKFDRRRILLITQSLALMQATTLAVLTIGGWVQPWQAILLAFFMGTVNSFELPARQSFMAELVDREDMVNAISLSSTVFSLARSVGPALAGLLVTIIGEGGVLCHKWCQLSGGHICSVVYAHCTTRSGATASKLKLCRQYQRHLHCNLPSHTVISDVYFCKAWHSAYLACNILQVLLPVYAAQVLHGNVVTLGLMRSCSGVGALLGALRLASSNPKKLPSHPWRGHCRASVFSYFFSLVPPIYPSLLGWYFAWVFV